MLTFQMNFIQETEEEVEAEELSLKGNAYNVSVDYDAIDKPDTSI